MTDGNGFHVNTLRLSCTLLLASALLFPSSVFANKYIESAKEYLDNNETNAAIIELKNAVKEEPKAGLPRFLLGEVYLESGSYASAEKELSRALKFGYSTNETLPLLAQSLFRQKKLGDVLLLLDEFDKPDSTLPNDFLAIAAITELRERNPASAQALLTRVTSDTSYSYLAEAVALSIDNKQDDALDKIDQAIKAQPKNSDAWLLKGNLEMLTKNYAAAVDSYENAAKYAPNAIEPRYLTAAAQVGNQEFEAAEPAIDQLLKVSEQSPSVNDLKAIIAYSKQDYETAKTHADRAVNNGSENLRVAIIAGMSAFQLGQFEQSRRALEQTVPKLQSNHPVVRVYSMTLLKLGHVDQAIETLGNYQVETDEDREFITQVSTELARIGRTEAALELALKASTDDVTRSDTSLGLIKLANNDMSGLEDLQKVLEKNPDSKEAKLAIASYYVNSRDYDKAKTLADEWLADEPNNISALMLKGVIESKQGNSKAAKSTFTQVIEQEPDNARALLALAELAMLEKETEQALKLTTQARELVPNNYNINKQYITLHQQLGSLDAAIKEIDKQLEQSPFSQHLKVSKANALVLKDQRKEAINVLESIPVEERDSTVYEFLANIYLSLDNKTDAQKNYRAWLAIAPYSPTAYRRNIQLANQTDNNVEALDLIKKANEMFPSDPRFDLMKIGIFITSNRLKDAQKSYDTLNSDIKITPAALQLQGRIQLANGQYDDAITTYKQRFETLPNIASALELTSAYTLADKPESGIQFLEKVIADYPDKTEFLKLKLAELQVQSDPQAAIRQYEAIVEKTPNNVPALNNLAWLYLEDDQVDKACHLAAKAYQLAERSVEVTDTYGFCLLKKGEPKRALELLERANQMKSDDPQIAIHYAESLLVDKQLAKAKEIVKGIETEDPLLVVDINRITAQIDSASK